MESALKLQLGALESLAVGGSSLDVSRTPDPDSEWIGRLAPGRPLQVLEVEPVSEDGSMRACVALHAGDGEKDSATWRELWPAQPDWRTPSWRAQIEEVREQEEVKHRMKIMRAQEAQYDAARRIQSIFRSKAARHYCVERRVQLKVALEEMVAAKAAKAAKAMEKGSTKGSPNNGRRGAAALSKAKGTPKAASPAAADAFATPKPEAKSPAASTAKGAKAAKAAESERPGRGKKGGVQKGESPEELAAKAAEEAEAAAEAEQRAAEEAAQEEARQIFEAEVAMVRDAVANAEARRMDMLYAQEQTAASDAVVSPLKVTKYRQPEHGWITIIHQGEVLVTKKQTGRLPAHVCCRVLSKLVTLAAGPPIAHVLCANRVMTMPRSACAIPQVRQQQLLRWSRRVARDEERERAKALARDRDIEDERRASAEPWGAACRSTRSALTPPTGVVAPAESSKGFGFAYGGVLPGRLHSKGRPIEFHDVHFSVAKSGRYHLYACLHGQPEEHLPGSPFALHVSPGKAHSQGTHIPATEMPLRGAVDRERYVCRLKLQARDYMGNACGSGGAQVECAFLNSSTPNANAAEEQAQDDSSAPPKQESTCSDLGNGMYALQWVSDSPGNFHVFVKVDGLHIVGSPAVMAMVGTKPPAAAPQSPPKSVPSPPSFLPRADTVVRLEPTDAAPKEHNRHQDNRRVSSDSS